MSSDSFPRDAGWVVQADELRKHLTEFKDINNADDKARTHFYRICRVCNAEVGLPVNNTPR
jgi:hypothetical protein